MPKSISFAFLALVERISLRFVVPTLLVAIQGIHAQAPSFAAVPAMAFDSSGPVIHAHTESLKPFTVAGERGVLLGQQDGTFEAWVLPVKVLSHLRIEANVEGYTVPIDVNQQSAEIEVRPDRTVITYAHIAFTVRQIMFSLDQGPTGTGPAVLFEFDCLHPTDFTFRFTPNLEFMWPMRNEGHPGPEWVTAHAAMRAGDSRAENDKSGLATSGYYVLHADYPDLAAALTIPGATAGILAPYQERPQVHPVELKLHIDPARDRGRLFPLLMAVGTNAATASSAALGATLEKLNQNIGALYQAHADGYKKLLANSVSIETPEKSLNEAFQWAVVSIEQLKAKPWFPDRPQTSSGLEITTGEPKGASASPQLEDRDLGLHPPDETALVAGYYASGDSARPGFGWFFGRDALYTLYAINGYGDFALAKSELEFLIHRQRDDGKIMHEYSQTAGAIDWLQFPYMYAAADSTPLFLLATLDYVRASGDTAFLTANREAIEKAWEFETSHAPGPEQGGNGIYTNEQGTGWVESWPGGMPHQEIYLALLDQQASAAMAQVFSLLNDQKRSLDAKSRAEQIAKTINDQFYDKDKHCYAFSRNKDGSLDRTTTVYPALAWWSELRGTIEPGGDGSILQHPEGCLQQLAAHTLNTDWGLRDVSNEENIYDGMSYHQGSVWPLFTGWAALAEYRGGQPLAAYQMLMENANLTKTQDLGAMTELLSGDFNVPFGRSTSHQLWSSAMVITPILRGLFGISIDASTKTITVNPHLPAGWQDARVKNLPLPGGADEITFAREGDFLTVRTENGKHLGWKLKSDAPGTQERESHLSSEGLMVAIPLPAVEVIDGRTSWIDFTTGEKRAAVSSPVVEPGARTNRFRVVAEHWEDHKATLNFEGPAGATGMYLVARHHLTPELKIDCADVKVSGPNGYSTTAPCTSMIDSAHRDPNLPIMLTPQIPLGEGWKTMTVTLTW